MYLPPLKLLLIWQGMMVSGMDFGQMANFENLAGFLSTGKPDT
jgi:hypothetical protein